LTTNAQVDTGARPGTTTAEHERVKALEREVKELRRTNETLKLASAFLVKLRWRLVSPRRSSSPSATSHQPRQKRTTGVNDEKHRPALQAASAAVK